MAQHNLLGHQGEILAKEYLLTKNYTIRDVNYRIGSLELDIVAEKDNWLIIVEVRTRSTDIFISPADTIGIQKIKRLVKAANAYIKKNNWQGETRFDIIAIISDETGYKIEHIIDAFLAPVS